MPHRVYLFEIEENGNRREMLEHPAHGEEWAHSGAMVKDRRGVYMLGTIDSVAVQSKRAAHAAADGEIEAEISDHNLVTLKAEHFPGKRILVKVWFAGSTPSEYRELMRPRNVATRADLAGHLESALQCLEEYHAYGERMRKIGRGFHPEDKIGRSVQDVMAGIRSTLEADPADES